MGDLLAVIFKLDLVNHAEMFDDIEGYIRDMSWYTHKWEV